MQRVQKQVYEQINDDQDQQQSKQTRYNNNNNQKHSYNSYDKQQNQPTYLISTQQQLNQNYQSNYTKSLSPNKLNSNPIHISNQSQTQSPIIKPQLSQIIVNHQQLGKYANLQQQNQDGENIKISINKSQRKGGIMSYYFSYIIQGYDTKGNYNISRRFNQFYEMRQSMITRWPGCFIPSIPAKNALNKNDPSIIKKRTRYLNHFVKRIAKLPHLYYSQQFQTLLRSQQSDISQVFSKWPTPTSQSIINKYRVNFSQLAGKQLNFDTTSKINNFSVLIKKNQSQLVKQRQNMKNLAQSHDKLIQSYGLLFTYIFPTYQKQCFAQYCGNKQTYMLYMNESQIKLQQHQTIVRQAMSVNPFWTFYDLIRHEQRDAMAFSQVFDAKSRYQTKKHGVQIKISENEKHVEQLSMGKKPLLGIGSKGTNEQIRYKLQVQIQQLKRQRQNLLIIIDIITAMIAYIQIQRYKSEKRQFYMKALTRIGANQINTVQNLGQIWNGIKQATENKLNTINNFNNYNKINNTNN